MTKQKYDLQGVGLLLFSNKGRILVLEELASKPIIQKVKGMLSFPLETLEADERPEDSVHRLMREEVGSFEMQNIQQFGAYFFTYPNCKVKIFAFSAHTKTEFEAEPADTDVEHHSWMYPQDLLKKPKIRCEVQTIIDSHAKIL
jgi:ADP-ribose pyrophosphatase YjhB (NUDIX family)